MRKKDNISFIIPAFNCAETIESTVASIYSGNFDSGDETIIVDDASTDRTAVILDILQKKYPSIKLFSHRYNKGSAAAGRNTGIEQSENDIIFCLDSDNILVPQSISKLKKFMTDQSADAAAFGIQNFFNSDIARVTHKWIYESVISLNDILNKPQGTPASSGNYLYTKKSWIITGRYNESIGGAMDSWDFAFRQVAKGLKMVTLAGSCYYHRYREDGAYFSDSKKVPNSIRILQGILPYLDLIDPKDVNYMMGAKGRTSWFDRIPTRKIRLKNKTANKSNPLTRYLRNLLLSS